MQSLSLTTFKGAARPLTAINVAIAAQLIGVGEDEVRAVIEVETRGGGFDRQGRPRMLFEPHVFYRELGEAKRKQAVSAGLAYPRWGQERYPTDSYPRLLRAIQIDRPAALRSASWGLGQIMGFNCRAAGYHSAEDMVSAFLETEEAHLRAMIAFIQSEGLDDDLRRRDWASFARGYNGAGYAQHGYHTRLATSFEKWSRIPDALAPEFPLVGPGSRGPVARRVQRLLLSAGFDPHGVDGWFGDDTEAAAKAWQASVGLTPDGIIGPKSWPILNQTPELSA